MPMGAEPAFEQTESPIEKEEYEELSVLEDPLEDAED
jgi:hypothetical protein